MLRLTDLFLIAILAFIAITTHRLLIIWFAEYVSYRYEVKWSRRQKPSNILPMAMGALASGNEHSETVAKASVRPPLRLSERC